MGMGLGAFDFDFKKRDLVVAGVEFLGEIQGTVRSRRFRPLDGWAVMGWHLIHGYGSLGFFELFCLIWFEGDRMYL
jgi:hypothetical protein